jgi:hypothetical protein
MEGLIQDADLRRRTDDNSLLMSQTCLKVSKIRKRRKEKEVSGKKKGYEHR